MRRFFVACAFIGFAAAAVAAEIVASADQGIERVNAIVAKINADLVAKKLDCMVESGSRACYYRSATGPGLNFVANEGSASVKTIVIVDARGLSPSGRIYINAVMEAFDPSLAAADTRRKFFDDLLAKAAASTGKTGTFNVTSGDLKYVYSWADKDVIFAITVQK